MDRYTEHHARRYSLLTYTLDTWVWSKDQNIYGLKVVTLHIKLEGMEQKAQCKHIFYPIRHPWPLWLGQKVKLNILKVVMLFFKLMGMEHWASCMHICVWPANHGQHIGNMTSSALASFGRHTFGFWSITFEGMHQIHSKLTKG